MILSLKIDPFERELIFTNGSKETSDSGYWHVIQNMLSAHSAISNEESLNKMIEKESCKK